MNGDSIALEREQPALRRAAAKDATLDLQALVAYPASTGGSDAELVRRGHAEAAVEPEGAWEIVGDGTGFAAARGEDPHRVFAGQPQLDRCEMQCILVQPVAPIRHRLLRWRRPADRQWPFVRCGPDRSCQGGLSDLVGRQCTVRFDRCNNV